MQALHFLLELVVSSKDVLVLVPKDGVVSHDLFIATVQRRNEVLIFLDVPAIGTCTRCGPCGANPSLVVVVAVMVVGSGGGGVFQGVQREASSPQVGMSLFYLRTFLTQRTVFLVEEHVDLFYILL